MTKDNKLDDRKKLVAVKNYPGIYKIFKGKKDTGKYLSTKRASRSRGYKRAKAVFSSFADAKDFRVGKVHKGGDSKVAHRGTVLGMKDAGHSRGQQAEPDTAKDSYLFSDLVSDWRDFHFLSLEEGSRDFYDRKLLFFSVLNDIEVESIDVRTIDELVKFWVHELPKAKSRASFEKELTVLTVILNFYRSRRNKAYCLPIEKQHYKSSTVKRKVKGEVAALVEEDLASFLAELKKQKNPAYYVLAAAQLGLSLRIGEACALDRRCIDLERKEIRIGQTVTWNDRTWEAKVKSYPKNNHLRYLSIPDFLSKILVEWMSTLPKGQNMLFMNKEKLMNRKTIATAYNRALKKLGIDYVSGTHMMRRTSATHANDVTGDFFAVSAQLDHSSPEITKRYVMRISKQKVKVAEALNQIGERAVSLL